MKIRNIMSVAVPTCGPRDPLLDAARVMLRHNVSCLPVVTADESRRFVGMPWRAIMEPSESCR
jgi:CBS domain-containing protein